MTVSIAGSWDIVEGLIAEIQAELATDLAAVIAGAVHPVPFTMSVPDSTDGLSRTPSSVPMDQYNALYLWVEDEERVDTFMNMGIERRKVTVATMWSMVAQDLQELNGRLVLGARALNRCINRRWRAMNVAIHSGRPITLKYRADSLRKSTKGREPGAQHGNIDVVVVAWSFVQQVEGPIEFT